MTAAYTALDLPTPGRDHSGGCWWRCQLNVGDHWEEVKSTILGHRGIEIDFEAGTCQCRVGLEVKLHISDVPIDQEA
jgi:hypothetical protein